MKYAVVDLEFCKVPKGYKKFGYKWCQETIQIGAVLLDEDYEIIDEFNTYVRPEFGRVDCFIENLTGISQADVMSAPHFEEALIASDIIPEGRAHDGLADAYNTALLFAKLEQDPDYELNEFYKTAREEETEHLSFSMGDLFAGIVLA